MERFLTSLVFCESPMDFAYGTPAATGAMFAADPRAGDASKPAKEAAKSRFDVSIKSAQRQAECAPAFDGLNCFETVVMPDRSSH